MYPTIDDLVSEAPLDFDRLRTEVVTGTAYAPSFGRHADLADQVAMLTQEFAGQSRLKLTHALLNMLLRRGISTGTVYAQFRRLWEGHGDLLLEILDTRWLISACDTICDHASDPAEKQSAVLVSLFANTVKLAESERLGLDTTGTPRPVPRGTALFDGMTAFVAGKGDMPANLLKRLEQGLDSSSISGAIGREVVTRCLGHDTVFSRFAAKQTLNTWPPYLRPASSGRSSPAALPPSPVPEEGDGPGYILLNDTARLGQSFHIGTVFACASIRKNLARRGFHELGWANDSTRFQALMARGPKPALVVVNGEGTLHHGSARAEELLALCQRAKGLGCAVVLINSLWEANPRRMLPPLRSIDLIHMRDSKSRAALPRRMDVTVTPDVSIQLFLETTKNGGYAPPAHAFGVIDSVVPQVTKTLLTLAEARGAPFYTMPVNTLRKTRAEVAGRAGPVRPQLLQVPDLMTASGWVTGRFHGMIAALCAGQPVCALRSNTAKVEAFLGDAGLAEACRLSRFWRRYSVERQMEEVTRRFEMQKEAGFIAKRNAFLQDAATRIDDMFDAVAALV